MNNNKERTLSEDLTISGNYRAGIGRMDEQTKTTLDQSTSFAASKTTESGIIFGVISSVILTAYGDASTGFTSSSVKYGYPEFYIDGIAEIPVKISFGNTNGAINKICDWASYSTLLWAGGNDFIGDLTNAPDEKASSSTGDQPLRFDISRGDVNMSVSLPLDGNKKVDTEIAVSIRLFGSTLSIGHDTNNNNTSSSLTMIGYKGSYGDDVNYVANIARSGSKNAYYLMWPQL